MAASFRAQVIVPVFSLRTQTLHVHIHVRQHLHHVFTGILARLIVVEAEIDHIQLRILPQPLQHRLNRRTAAGHIAVFQPTCRKHKVWCWAAAMEEKAVSRRWWTVTIFTVS